jgi:hypothetical protein
MNASDRFDEAYAVRDATAEVSPAIGLLTARPGRLLRRRAAVASVGILARLGWVRGFAIWPALDRPAVAVDLSSPRPARWVRETFELRGVTESRGRLRAFRRRVDAATWSAVRARGLLIGDPDGLAVEAAESALERKLDRPAVAFYSPSGAPSSKANLFVFEGDSAEPLALVTAMAQPNRELLLRREIEAVKAARARLSSAPDVAVALPFAPIWTGEVYGRFAAVFPVDPMAGGTGVEDRPRALDWLRRFQAATSIDEREWTGTDHDQALATVEEAWSILRPRFASDAVKLADALLRGLAGSRFRPCAVHGDYWRGNIATGAAGVRVYDWEWWREQGHPAFDLWTYEFADLPSLPDAGPVEIESRLRMSLRRARAEASSRGFDAHVVRSLLMPVLAELAIRNRRQHGLPSPPEIRYSRVMAAAEVLLARSAATNSRSSGAR